MKNEHEIKELAKKHFHSGRPENELAIARIGFAEGYTQSQKDMQSTHYENMKALDEQVERLQAENERLRGALECLLEGVKGLPPLIAAIAGVLTPHCKKATEALNN